jgi:hypothetical protein
MHVARTQPRGDAFMILALDDDVPEDVAASIRAHPGVADLWIVRLGNGDGPETGAAEPS